LNREDKDYITKNLSDRIDFKSSYYTTTPIESIIFSYGVRKGRTLDNTTKSDRTEIKYQTYYHYKFPISYDPLNYGRLLHKFNNTYFM
jgi:hypothetical protein